MIDFTQYPNVDYEVRQAKSKSEQTLIKFSVKKIKELNDRVDTVEKVITQHEVINVDLSIKRQCIFEAKFSGNGPNFKISNYLITDRLTTYGLQKIAINLVHFNSIVELNLSGSVIYDFQAIFFCEALMKNRTIQILRLKNNKFTNSSAEAFSHVLKIQSSLKQVDLFGNNFTKIGIESLAKSLRFNQSIIGIDLRNKDTNLNRVKPILKILRFNTRLIDLDYI